MECRLLVRKWYPPCYRVPDKRRKRLHARSVNTRRAVIGGPWKGDLSNLPTYCKEMFTVVIKALFDVQSPVDKLLITIRTKLSTFDATKTLGRNSNLDANSQLPAIGNSHAFASLVPAVAAFVACFVLARSSPCAAVWVLRFVFRRAGACFASSVARVGGGRVACGLAALALAPPPQPPPARARAA